MEVPNPSKRTFESGRLRLKEQSVSVTLAQLQVRGSIPLPARVPMSEQKARFVKTRPAQASNTLPFDPRNICEYTFGHSVGELSS